MRPGDSSRQPVPRSGQDRGRRGDAVQAGAAGRGGTAGNPPPPAIVGVAARAVSLCPGRSPSSPSSTTSATTVADYHGVPRRGHPHRGPCTDCRGQLRRHDVEPAVPTGIPNRGGAGRTRGHGGDPVPSAGGHRVRGHGRRRRSGGRPSVTTAGGASGGVSPASRLSTSAGCGARRNSARSRLARIDHPCICIGIDEVPVGGDGECRLVAALVLGSAHTRRIARFTSVASRRVACPGTRRVTGRGARSGWRRRLGRLAGARPPPRHVHAVADYLADSHQISRMPPLWLRPTIDQARVRLRQAGTSRSPFRPSPGPDSPSERRSRPAAST